MHFSFWIFVNLISECKLKFACDVENFNNVQQNDLFRTKCLKQIWVYKKGFVNYREPGLFNLSSIFVSSNLRKIVCMQNLNRY